MTLRTLFLAAVGAAACVLLVTPGTTYGQTDRESAAQPPESGAEIALLVRQLEAHAAENGVEIGEIEVSRSSDSRGSSAAGDDVGTMSPSCTATATGETPAGTRMKLSPTAPTCVEAMEMLGEVIADIN